MNFNMEDMKSIAFFINSFGGRTMLVGGAVRDMLLGRQVKDFDLEVYGVVPEALPLILKPLAKSFRVGLDSVGASFQVYKLGHTIDVSLPRRDRKVGEGHKGFVIEGDPNMSFEDASRRRDFTINSMLLDPLTNELVDPFGGKADLENGVLRMVDPDTFVEDSLRALRAVQFAARFDLRIDQATKDVIRSMDLSDLPSERIYGEMEKLLLSSKPSIGLDLMLELGMMDKLLPEVSALVDVPQEEEWHPEGDVYVHTMHAVDEAAFHLSDISHSRRVTVMLATLCHDLGKATTTEMLDGRWRAHGHADAGVPLAAAVLDRLNVHTIDGFDVRTQVLELVRLHMRIGEIHRAHLKGQKVEGQIRKLSRFVELDLLNRVHHADSFSRNNNDLGYSFSTETQDWFGEAIRNLKVEVAAPERIVMGRDLIALGMKPSKQFAPILEHFYERQLEGEFSTKEEAMPLLISYLEEGAS